MQGDEFQRVSVIVPAYNASATIVSTLESAKAQSRPADEIIVVDDGSSDNTAELAESCGVIVHRVANGGPGRARNHGASHATGDVLFFLDADDLWAPQKIQRHLEEYRRGHPSRSFVFDITQRVRVDGKLSGVAGIGRPGLVHWNELIDFRNWTCGSCPSVPRRKFESVGGYNEKLRFAEDIEMLIRVSHEHGPGARVNEVGTFYRLQENSLSRQRHPVEETVEHFAERVPFLDDSQRQALAQTVAVVNALHSPPFQFFPAILEAGPSILKDPRIPKFIALRILHFVRVRPL